MNKEESPPENLSLGSQSALILAAKLFGFGLSFVLPLLIVRYLTLDEVGIYRQIFLVINNAVAVLPLGMGMSAYYFLSREDHLRRPTVLNILIFLFLMGGIAFASLFLFPGVLDRVFHHRELTDLAPLAGIVIWLWIVGSFLEIVALANREVWLATVFIIFAQFSKAVLMLAAVFSFASAEGFLYAALLQGIIQVSVLFYYLRSRFSGFLFSFDHRFFIRHLAYALPFGFAGILFTFQTDLHNYFVGYKFSPAEYAIYAYGCFQLPLIGLMTESVTSVMIPRISGLQLENNKREIFRITGRAMEKMSLVFFPLYAFLLVTADTFVITLFSREYAASIPIFVINITLIPFMVWINDPTVRAFPELGRFLLILRCIFFGALVATLFYGIQHFDLAGMITIVVVIALLEKTILTTAVLRKLEVGRSDLDVLKRPAKTAISALVAGAVTYGFHYSFAEPLNSYFSGWIKVVFVNASTNLVDFAAGAILLSVCLLVFTPVYFLLLNRFGLIQKVDRELIGKIVPIQRFFNRRSDI